MPFHKDRKVLFYEIVNMKRRIGKAGITLILGTLSTIFGIVIGSTLKDQTLDITKLRKDGHAEDNKSA